jgi:hypothetical protein
MAPGHSIYYAGTAQTAWLPTWKNRSRPALQKAPTGNPQTLTRPLVAKSDVQRPYHELSPAPTICHPRPIESPFFSSFVEDRCKYNYVHYLRAAKIPLGAPVHAESGQPCCIICALPSALADGQLRAGGTFSPSGSLFDILVNHRGAGVSPAAPPRTISWSSSARQRHVSVLASQLDAAFLSVRPPFFHHPRADRNPFDSK